MEIQQHLKSFTGYLLIFLFTYTGVNKLIDHAVFKSTLLHVPVIATYAGLISWLVPLLELLIVITLAVEKYRRVGFQLSLILMTAFTVYISCMILFVPHLPCSCGGVLQGLSWSNHIIFNCLFILLILISLGVINRQKLFIAINRESRNPV